MSYSRFFRALMSMLACLAVLAALGSGANASNSAGSTGTKAGSPAKIETKGRKGPVVLKVADYSVNFGGRFRLRGKSGRLTRGHIRIQSSNGNGWQTIRKVKTDGSGHFSVKVAARTRAALRAVAGDGHRSKIRHVTVIGQIRLDRPERYVKLGRSLRVSGVVLPRGSRVVRLRVRGQGTVSTRSRASGRFVLSFRPRENGDFSYRVQAGKSSRSTGDFSLFRRFSALRPGHASYYGPGLYGNGVACGGTLTPTTRGVANKYLPCGTRVTLQYGGRTVVARVVDRGPYVAGRDWDLTEQTKKDLGFGGVGVVWTNK